MNPKTRLNLVLAACAVVAVGIAAAVMNVKLRQHALDEMQRDAQLHMDAAMALRRYTSDHVRPALLDSPNGFTREAMPSFAAITAMRDMHKNYPGVEYLEVALNPINLSNLAVGVQADLVEELRRTRAESLSRLVAEPKGETFYLARPLKVTSEGCLSCHGPVANAPAGLRAIYGDVNGYDWKLGDVVGAQIIKHSLALPLAEVRVGLMEFLAGACAVVLAVFLALNTMLRHVLLNPMVSRESALNREAGEDPLTGALNRRGFTEPLREAMAEGRRSCVIVVDVDHFKQLNDTHGHLLGDNVLQQLVQRLRDNLRRGDAVARLGGDEFALLLPDTALGEARELARSLLHALHDTAFEHGVPVHFSLGVAQWNGMESASAWMSRADRALYRAKGDGRGQVSVDSAFFHHTA